MTGSAGKHSTSWHKTVNLQGFSDIIADTLIIYANFLENIREI